MNDSEDKLCNLCGLTCNIGPKDSPASGPHGLIDAAVIGGYESTPGNGHGALDDMDRYRFSLCEFCLDWLFSQFKIPVAMDAPMNDFLLQPGESIDDALDKRGWVQIMEVPQPPPWKPAAQRVAEDDWRQWKKEFYEEAARRAAARSQSK